MRRKLRVIVLMGGKSPEHEVSLISGREVVRHLNPKKYEVLPLVISRDGKKWQLKKKEELLAFGEEVFFAKDLARTEEEIRPEETPKRADVVFIAMHGPFGEDGTIQGMLQIIGIPYTGAGLLASALGMDKPMFRKIMQANGIISPKYLVLKKGDGTKTIFKEFSFPLVVKPSSQGSSVGVSIVRRKKELKEAMERAFYYGPRIVIEEYLSGPEVSCGVLGNEKPLVLPVVEIVPKKEFFDYEAKYGNDFCEEIVPARISEEITRKVQDTAVSVYKAIGCRGFGRVDMIIKNDIPYVLEINTIPGLTPVSLLPKEALTAGITYPKLIEEIIKLALEKR